MSAATPVIDMHCHIIERPILADDLHLDPTIPLDARIDRMVVRLDASGVERAVVYLLDPSLLDREPRWASKRVTGAIMIDFRAEDAVSRVVRARSAGLRGVKLLTYEQKITPEDHPSILALAREVHRCGMFLTICATFGSKRLGRHDAIGLASYLLDAGFDGPLIMAHAGGTRVMELLLLMDDAPNVYTDTSFTTTYLSGSRLIEDLGYLVQRFEGRCFFGSDAPYVAYDKALRDALVLAGRLPPAMARAFLYDNAAAFLERHTHA